MTYEFGNFGDFGDVFGVPPSIVHEYPIAAGFPSVTSSSGVATLDILKPVSWKRPGCCIFRAEKRGAGLSKDIGDTMLSRFLLFDNFSVDDDLLWPPQDGVTMLSLSVSAAEGLRSTKVGVGQMRLISTVSATEILRSVQIGWEPMPIFTRLPLLLW